MLLSARLSSFVCLSVCLSVCVQDYSKTRRWMWLKCCVSTECRDMEELVNICARSSHSPDAEPDSFLP